MRSQKVLDVILFIFAVYGVYSFGQGFGILMGFWALMAVPLFFSIFLGKKSPVWLWRFLFIFGIVAFLIKVIDITKLEIDFGELLLPPSILILFIFGNITGLFIHRAYVGNSR